MAADSNNLNNSPAEGTVNSANVADQNNSAATTTPTSPTTVFSAANSDNSSENQKNSGQTAPTPQDPSIPSPDDPATTTPTDPATTIQSIEEFPDQQDFDRLPIKILRKNYDSSIALSLVSFLEEYELRDGLLINLKFGLILDHTSSDSDAVYAFREGRTQINNFSTQIYFEDLVCFLKRLCVLFEYQAIFNKIQDFASQYPNLYEFIQITRDLPPTGPMTFAEYDLFSKNFSFLKPDDLQEIARQFNAALAATGALPTSDEGQEEAAPTAEAAKTTEPVGSTSAAKSGQEPESGEETGEEEEDKTQKIPDEELKISDLSREQANYIEGFIQIALNANLAPLGIEFSTLPPEMQLALRKAARDQVVTYLMGQSKGRLDQLTNNTDNVRLKLLSEINHVLLINPEFTHLLQGAVNYHYSQTPDLTDAQKQALSEQLSNLKNPQAYEAELQKISLDEKYQDTFTGLSQLPGFNDNYRSDFLTELAALTGISVGEAAALTQRLERLSPIADTIDSMLLEDLMNPDSYAGLEVLFSADLAQMQQLFGGLIREDNLEPIRQLMLRYFKQRHIAWARKYRIFGVNLKQREFKLSQPEALQTEQFTTYQKSVGQFRQAFVTPFQSKNLEEGDRAVDLLMGNPPVDATNKEKKFFAAVQQQAFNALQQEQAQQQQQTLSLLMQAQQIENFSAIKALEAFLLYQNQIDASVNLAAVTSPLQLLGDPANPAFQQFGMNSARQALSGARNLAGQAGNKLKEKAFDVGLDVVAPGAGTILSQITMSLNAIPVVGPALAEFLNKKKRGIVNAILAALLAALGFVALSVLAVVKGLSSLLKLATPAISSISTAAAPSVAKGLSSAAYESKGALKDLGSVTRNKLLETSKLGTKVSKTFLGGEATMSKLAFQSVLYPVVAVAGGTLIVLTVIQSAFLLSVPYAPVTQVKTASLYVDFRKDLQTSCGASCTNHNFGSGPVKATYSLTIAPKGNYTIVINDLKDVLSANVNRELSNATITDRILENSQLIEEDFPLTLKPGESKTITYEEGFDSQYNHSNVRNNATLSFTYQETDPETGAVLNSGEDQAIASKSLCIGQCPISANVEVAENIFNALKDCGYQKDSKNGAVSDSVFLNQSNWYVNVGDKIAAKACLLNHGLSDYVVNTLQTSVDRYTYVQCVAFAIASGEGKLEALGDAKNYCAANGIMGNNEGDWAQLQEGDYVVSGSGAYGHIAVVYSVINNYQVQLIEADGLSGFIQIRGLTIDDLDKNYCGFIRR